MESTVLEIAREAKDASIGMALTSADARNNALGEMARALRDATASIIEENGKDMQNAGQEGMSEGLLDRLMLDEGRIEDMACALESLADLADPLGVVQVERTLYNGIDLKRISVPLGVVAMVYEARPNVTADAAGICIKTGNAVVLRGGSAAQYTNRTVAGVLADAAVRSGMPGGCIGLIDTVDRAATDELMSLHGIVDVLIPRGGSGLIAHCVNHSKVPVIETGTGNCHIYVHESADLLMAQDIVINAKCRRVGVCNAAETLLVDRAIAQEFLPGMLKELVARRVTVHGDEMTLECAARAGIDGVVPATESDWETEYLAAEIAVKCVGGSDEAIAHINRFGTKHSEAVVTEDERVAETFCAAIDAAAVYVNASTAFTDGGEFGMGAEIGISTQKLHARGPFALEALTSYKYVLRGNGQVRS